MATCAFAMIKNRENKILLVQISPPFAEAYKWNFPGGVVEEGEEIVGGLIREVMEETGIRCAVLDKKDTFVTSNGQDEINVYDAVYVRGDIAIQEEEILQARWYTAEEALALLLAFSIRDYIS